MLKQYMLQSMTMCMISVSPPLSTDGNLFSHVHWLAKEKDETTTLILPTSLKAKLLCYIML